MSRYSAVSGQRSLIAAVLFWFVMLFAGTASASRAIPKFSYRVVDEAGLLSGEERDELEKRLLAYEKATGHQIAVLTVKDLGDETLEDFSYRVAKAWKLGQDGKDDGILITVARFGDVRRLRIEVGKGLEGDLTDIESDQIIVQKIRPFTKQERWYDGLWSGIAAIEQKLSGKVYGPEPVEVPREAARGRDVVGTVFTIIFIALIIFLFFRSRGGGGGGPFIFFGGGGGFGGGGFGGGGGGGGGWDPPSGGGGDFGGGGASDDV